MRIEHLDEKYDIFFENPEGKRPFYYKHNI